MIQKLSILLTNKAIKSSICSVDEFDNYVYGFQIFFGKLLTYSLLLIVGIISKKTISLAAYIVPLVILRGYSGGYHAKTQIGCTVFTCFIAALSILIVNIYPDSVYSHWGLGVSTILSSIYILIYTPINHVNLNFSGSEIKQQRKLIKIYLLMTIVVIIIFICIKQRELLLSVCFAVITVAFLMFLAKMLKQEVQKED